MCRRKGKKVERSEFVEGQRGRRGQVRLDLMLRIGVKVPTPTEGGLDLERRLISGPAIAVRRASVQVPCVVSFGAGCQSVCMEVLVAGNNFHKKSYEYRGGDARRGDQQLDYWVRDDPSKGYSITK